MPNLFSLTPPARRLAGRFLRCERGGFGLWLGAAFPALVALAFGAVELTEVTRDRTRLQDAADAAALMAARELSMNYTDGVADRAEGFALNQLADVAATSTVTVEATIAGSEATVNITSNRMGFFANMLPPGGFWTRVKAVAAANNEQPLCVLGLQSTASQYGALNVSGSASLEGNGCLMHSNENIHVTSTNLTGLKAGTVEATGTGTGRISPAPVNGAPLTADPFLGREFPYGSCAGINARLTTYSGGSHTISEGNHCGGFQVNDETSINFAPGIHYFDSGNITLSNTSRMTGANVVLVFGPNAKLKTQTRSYVSLTGRESGPYAGMVMVSTPTNVLPFEIYSENVDRLEGVVYLPNTSLIVYGGAGGQVAEQSDWTVTVTKWLVVAGSAKLIIKTDYASSTVPVPAGVGPSSGGGQVKIIR